MDDDGEAAKATNEVGGNDLGQTSNTIAEGNNTVIQSSNTGVEGNDYNSNNLHTELELLVDNDVSYDLDMAPNSFVDAELESETDSEVGSLDDIEPMTDEEEYLSFRQEALRFKKSKNKIVGKSFNLGDNPCPLVSLVVPESVIEDETINDSDWKNDVQGIREEYGSDENSTESEYSPGESSEDDDWALGYEDRNKKKKSSFVPYNPKIAIKDFDFCLNMTFNGPAEFKQVIKEYATVGGFPVYYSRNTNTEIQMKCNKVRVSPHTYKYKPKCPWEIWVSYLCNEKTFVVKTYKGVHTCTTHKKIDIVKSNWLAKKYGDKIRCNPFIKITQLHDDIQKEMAVDAWILKARYKTIIFMLEDIRRLVMIRLQKNRDLMRTNQLPFGKRIHTKLNNFILQSRYCSCIWNGDNKYEVRDDKYEVVTVDIDFKRCTCKKWDLTGIPCEHAVNVLHSMRLQPQDFVDKCYSKETYLMSYQNMLTPHNGMSFWPEDNRAPIRPPLIRKMPGKPKKNRRKEVGEDSKKPTKTNRVNTDGEASQVSKSSRKGYQVKCSICKVSGHNKLRCPMKPAGEPSIKRKPRQKKQQQYDEATASTAWARTGPTGPVGQK